MARRPGRQGRARIAVRLALLEANNFHEETLFAFLFAAGDADVTVFAPDHWRSREFACDELGFACEWRPFAGFTPDVDAVLVNTFPSPAGQPAVETALAAGRPVLGLVHDVEFFALPGGARAALERHPNLRLAYAGPAPPPPVDAMPAGLRTRIGRFFPVLRFDSDRGEPRSGVALPGALEYARRDFSTALRLTAETQIPLRIFGRSGDHGDGPKLPRDLDRERERLLAEIRSLDVAACVEIHTDVSCGDFYRAVDASRFVAVMPVSPQYLAGKLTGAVTAALSCGVPMVALRDVHAYYTGADPAIFGRSMLALDAGGDDWRCIVLDTPEDAYDELARAAREAREALIAENRATVTRLLDAA